ncbi:MAG: NUDIX domain-containing protein [Candidatus Berkelbacteria bacterium]|nr:NUDIX domain-containing protein [Candidatus Berkelbacteria bacterium]MCR4307280.1 NUDIX domain-containing protein [Candidatus Berkelbacteria bacterium]
MAERRLPKVGVGVIIRKNGKVLFGQRLNAHGHGTWSFPGGHLEFGETFEHCAKREVAEEAGVTIQFVKIGPVTNDIHKREDKHYVTVFVICDWVGGVAKNLEPDKLRQWKWVKWGKLPQPQFLPVEQLLATGYSPFTD